MAEGAGSDEFVEPPSDSATSLEPTPTQLNRFEVATMQGVVKVFLELSNKNCDHGSHIPEVQLGEVSRLKLRV